MSAAALRELAEGCAATQRHRGPDGAGVFVDERHHVALAHRRLSILDLSSDGSQPMCSPSGRFVISYNGEIYNHQALRKELLDDEDYRDLARVSGGGFRGHSDTETLLAAIETWGIVRTLERVNGMFAFALWDRQENTLTVARDRLGIKPLYVATWGKSLYVSSDLAFVRKIDHRPTLSNEALAAYLRFCYVPTPLSIYEDCQKLEPGTLQTYALSKSGSFEYHRRRYWQLGQNTRVFNSDDEAICELETLLRDATQLRLLSDVPVGAFLSGGIDSSAVVASLSETRRVKTFSIGFSDGAFDESQAARAIANHLGAEHHERILNWDEALSLAESIPNYYAEPFADSSQIPTLLVSKFAKEYVSVALSGDGGDELFGGYNRYRFAPMALAISERTPSVLKPGLVRALKTLGKVNFESLRQRFPGTVPRLFGDKLTKLGKAIAFNDEDALFIDLASHGPRPQGLLKPHFEENYLHAYRPRARGDHDFAARMARTDLETYLTDDILTKVDRASMAVSLEARVPLLDHRLVEFAFGLPPEMKIRTGTSKWILRQVLHKRVPRTLIDRPKMGFGMPVGAWLRGPLRSWARDLTGPAQLKKTDLLDTDAVDSLWRRFENGTPCENALWTVLMLQSWLEAQ